MAYLGNTPAARFSAMDKQTITGDGTTGPYTLDHAVGNEQEIEVFVNNVRQEPSVAYTVSGTDLTMTGNVASTDDFYVVFQGKAQQTATHPSGSELQATTGTFSGALSATTGTFSGALSATTGTFSGAVSMGANNITFSNGNGIDFSASAGSGASSSILDDYEEGTWTPVLDASTTSPTSPTSGSGVYTKIGDQVMLFGILTNVSVSGASGNAKITGLPFVGNTGISSGNTPGTAYFNEFLFSNANDVYGLVETSSAQTHLNIRIIRHNTNAVVVACTTSYFKEGATDIRFQITYRTTA